MYTFTPSVGIMCFFCGLTGMEILWPVKSHENGMFNLLFKHDPWFFKQLVHQTLNPHILASRFEGAILMKLPSPTISIFMASNLIGTQQNSDRD